MVILSQFVPILFHLDKFSENIDCRKDTCNQCLKVKDKKNINQTNLGMKKL